MTALYCYMSIELDKLDKVILNEIQKDISQPKVSLVAKRLGKPVTTIHQRLKKLKKEGIIKGYIGKVDPEKIGKPLIVWILLAFESAQEYEKIGEKLSHLPCIQEVHFVSGIYSFLIKLRVKDVNEYYQISTQQIQQMPGLIRIEGIVTYKTFLERDEIFV